jgi:hypothetical protein
MRRIGDGPGFQFDVSEKDFRISEGTQDAPPFAHGFRLELRNSTSALDISFGSRNEMEKMDTEVPLFTFSEHLQKRDIFDGKRQLWGEDDWGYLDRQKRWRRIHLLGQVDANYSSANDKEAKRFDQVINSVCLLRPKP